MRRNLSLGLLFEASQQMINKILQDNEEWINSAPNEEQKSQRINYILSSIKDVNDNLVSSYPSFVDKNNLKNLKLQSKESYGWIDQLSPEERESELKDEKLKAEYDFHKNLMKTRPHSLSAELYDYKIHDPLDDFTKTDSDKYFSKLDQEGRGRAIFGRKKGANGVIFGSKLKNCSIAKDSDDFFIANSRIIFKTPNSFISIIDSKIINSNLISTSNNLMSGMIGDFYCKDSTFSTWGKSFVGLKIENSIFRIGKLYRSPGGKIPVVENCNVVSKFSFSIMDDISSLNLTDEAILNNSKISSLNLKRKDVRIGLYSDYLVFDEGAFAVRVPYEEFSNAI